MSLVMISAMAAFVAGATAEAPMPTLSAVPFTDVALNGGFWTPWVVLTQEKILQHNLKYCESVGKIDNFRIVAKRKEGKHAGAVFEDSDVYKVIEGAAYCFAHKRDAELEKTVDDIIELIAASQQPDGYLDTYFTLVEPDKRWTDDTKHETYCAGHLIEAAVAYYQSTGKRALLDVAIKLADHLWATFGPNGKQTDVSEHEEIELALIKLWRQTGNENYLELAKLFVERRGHMEGRKNPGTNGIWGEYCQDHKPFREQTEIVGHAVRAMYLYCGATDIAAMTGDAGYLSALDSIWHDVTQRKMYVTGGVGDSARHNEGVSVPYFLPNDSAYCETCASIGMALWNQRMALLHADAKYADIVELEMFNGILGGVSMDGSGYYYCNRLACSDHRPPWQGCSCCPTNIVRFLPSIAGYMYASNGNNLYVNQFAPATTKVPLKDATVTLVQETDYPWDGAVRLTIDGEKTTKFALRLRVPAWCQGAQSPDDLYQSAGKPEKGVITLLVNDVPVTDFAIEKGYAVIEREWVKGDAVTYRMPMPVRRVKANAKVEADAGRVALQRGPIVYCLESVDNERSVRSIALPPDTMVMIERRPDLLGGVTILKGAALARGPEGSETKPFTLTAIPFYARDNRTPGYLQVWLPEDAAKAEPHPQPTIATEAGASTSFKNGDTVDALNDLVEPKNSRDQNIPRMTWWDHLGTAEWAQYDFKEPVKVSGVEVYWFDDTGIGQCRVPESWQLLHKDGDEWKPVKRASEFGVKKDAYNRVTFRPVVAGGLRIEAKLQAGFSGGILEWRVLEAK